MTVDQDYNIEKELFFKDEHYLIRDNGAICRLAREGKLSRKTDGVWTFGRVTDEGYVVIGDQRVHRLVAMAFHGMPENESLVVDHIDENRQNNRPENLRWLTRLENVLKNEYTRRKVEIICGSIDAFLDNPSLLFNHINEDKNFGWMRAVTKEEADAFRRNKDKWLNSNQTPSGGSLGEWAFSTRKSYDVNVKVGKYYKLGNRIFSRVFYVFHIDLFSEHYIIHAIEGISKEEMTFDSYRRDFEHLDFIEISEQYFLKESDIKKSELATIVAKYQK